MVILGVIALVAFRTWIEYVADVNEREYSADQPSWVSTSELQLHESRLRHVKQTLELSLTEPMSEDMSATLQSQALNEIINMIEDLRGKRY